MARNAPTCRVCNFPHWSYDSHKFPGGHEVSKEVRELASSKVGRNLATIVQARTEGTEVDLTVAFDGIGPLTPESARALTDRAKIAYENIRGRVDYMARVLELAHRRQAWKALGDESWNAFIEVEFEISKRRANQLVSHRQFMLALGPGKAESDTSGYKVPTLTEGQTRAVRGDPAKVARVQRAVAQGVDPVKAIKRATSRTKDPATGIPCIHERTLTVLVCAECGRRLE